MEYDVFYMKPEFFRDGVMGFMWCERKGRLPKPSALSNTHVYLKTVKANDLYHLYHQMQGEVWSPNGEARELIQARGLQHTSMSVGDVAVSRTGEVYMVDNIGFKKLN